MRLIEARGAYTPVALETFTLTLEGTVRTANPMRWLVPSTGRCHCHCADQREQPAEHVNSN